MTLEYKTDEARRFRSSALLGIFMNIGDKIVCVDDSGCKNVNCKGGHPVGVVSGKVYVVRKLFADAYGNPGVGVIGVSKTCPSADWDILAASRFRKLEDMKLCATAYNAQRPR